MEYATLSNGVIMPKLGFGVFQVPGDETARCVSDAVEVGYRHIDTAQSYMNESEVGQGIRDSGIDRSELFITTKVWIEHYGYVEARESVERSLRRLGLDYLDLVLLHQPFADVYGSWHALEELYKEGKVRAIGVSNFSPVRLADLAAFNEIAPMINQVETNPFHQQIAAHEHMVARHVQHEAWAPFGEGRSGMFTNPVLSQIAEDHGKSVAQVVLRWLMQRDIVALAKSTHKERMAENLDIFDFTLDDDDMRRIAALDTTSSLFFDHDDPHTVDMFVRMVADRHGKA